MTRESFVYHARALSPPHASSVSPIVNCSGCKRCSTGCARSHIQLLLQTHFCFGLIFIYLKNIHISTTHTHIHTHTGHSKTHIQNPSLYMHNATCYAVQYKYFHIRKMQFHSAKDNRFFLINIYTCTRLRLCGSVCKLSICRYYFIYTILAAVYNMICSLDEFVYIVRCSRSLKRTWEHICMRASELLCIVCIYV